MGMKVPTCRHMFQPNQVSRTNNLYTAHVFCIVSFDEPLVIVVLMCISCNLNHNFMILMIVQSNN